MRLQKYLIYDFSIQPIEIARKEIPSGARVDIAGWGKQSSYGTASERLKMNALKKLSSRKCASSLGIGFPGFICLGHAFNNGACFVSLNDFNECKR